MSDTYMIVRWYDNNRINGIKQRGLTLEQAKKHCIEKGTGTGWKEGFTKE